MDNSTWNQPMPETSGPQPKTGNAVESGSSMEPDRAAPSTSLAVRPDVSLEQYIPVRREIVEKRTSRRLDVLAGAYSDAEFQELARENPRALKDFATAEAIYTDKLLDIRGQPNRSIGSDTRAKLGELAVAAMQELVRRGLDSGPRNTDTVTVIEPK